MQEVTKLDAAGGVDKLWQEMIRDKKERYKSNPEVVQVISPYRGEFYGTGSLNLLMQKVFNAKYSEKNWMASVISIKLFSSEIVRNLIRPMRIRTQAGKM